MEFFIVLRVFVRGTEIIGGKRMIQQAKVATHAVFHGFHGVRRGFPLAAFLRFVLSMLASSPLPVLLSSPSA